jgi:acyl-CoA synthetase (AMP-forming)/AMP-acid ligase II
MGLGMSESFGPYWWGAPEGPDDLVTPPLQRLSPGWQLKVVRDDGELAGDAERGEIRIRGPHLAVGLQKVERPLVFDDDGFYRTGDIGLVDGNVIRFRGRAGDMVKVNGANVALPEVVEAIKAVPGVQEAYVCAVPDATSGSRLLAAAVPAVDARLCVEDVVNDLRQNLASYKVPGVVELLTAEIIPMTPSGRLDQPKFRALLMRLLADRNVDGSDSTIMTEAESESRR